MKELKNRYTGTTQAVEINLSPEIVDYFQGVGGRELPYQQLVTSILPSAKKRKSLTMKWVARQIDRLATKPFGAMAKVPTFAVRELA